MDMKRHDFESSIKCSDSYPKLIYMHGEKLFIFDDGKYKIAAMQLAWEIYCDRHDEIEGLRAQQAKVDELQKRVDKALQALKNKIEKVQKYEQDSFDHGAIIGLESALRTVEQALKGEG